MVTQIGRMGQRRWSVGPLIAAFTVVLLAFPLTELLRTPLSGALVALGLVGIVAFAAAIGTAAAIAAQAPGTGRGQLAFAFAAVAAILPVAPLGTAWLAVVAFYAAALLPIVLAPRRLVLGYAAAIALVGAGLVAVDATGAEVVRVLVPAAVLGVFTGAFHGFIGLSRRYVQSRTELADSTALAERQRIARDLHDLLGQQLTAIAMKSQVVQALVAVDPDRAGAEAAEVGELARSTLGELRATLADLRTVSLAVEARSAAELLEAAGVTAEVRIPPQPLPDGLDEPVAWIVREAVTNVVRHARATRCAIDVVASGTGIDVTVADDGPRDRPAVPVVPGTGLIGLRARAEAVGGELWFGADAGWFRVRATIPVPAA